MTTAAPKLRQSQYCRPNDTEITLDAAAQIIGVAKMTALRMI